MRSTSLLLASLVVSAAVGAQQPGTQIQIRPGQPAPPPGGCPLYVVDGQIVGGGCDARPNARPDWTTPPPAEDPLARFLYPPELVMAHQDAIGLTDKQRTAIQESMKDAQSKLIDMQFRMSGEVEKLQKLIQAPSPDEAKVLDQVNRVLTLERDVKLTQMTLMVRIKSQLTERQQSQLNQMRGAATPRPGG